MDIQIITTTLTLNIHGFSGTAINKDYAGTAFRLMDKMWNVIKTKGLMNKGLNIWVYEPNEKVFAGVELDNSSLNESGLEQKDIFLRKYASYKHIGPYGLIKQTGKDMTSELKKNGFEICDPYIEIYGHWTNDESKLETGLIMNLK
jgi:effector-binding domain-containing protein